MNSTAQIMQETEKPLTPAEQAAVAIQHAQAALPEATNIKLLQAVLLEVAAQTLAENPTFLDHVKQRYIDLAPRPKTSAKKGTSASKPRPTPRVSDFVETLVPIKHIPNFEINLATPPDPYLLLEVFGPNQLAKALDQHTLANLKKAVALMQERNPGTAPTGKTKPALIKYLVAQVTHIA